MSWNKKRSGPWIAVVGLCVVTWLTLTGGFSASPWAWLLLLLIIPQAIWIRKLVEAGRPELSMVVPVVGLFVWFAAIVAGAYWFGWDGTTL